MVKYEEKFIVINRKHLVDVPTHKVRSLDIALEDIGKHLPDNKYYVCNQDEPYAEDVWSVISDGEDARLNGPGTPITMINVSLNMLAHILDVLDDIQNPRIKYNSNKLEMADAVILENKSKAEKLEDYIRVGLHL